MNFDQSEEQELIAASIARFTERDYTFEQRRRIVASPQGWSAAVWQKMAELGLLGLTVSTEHGGLGGGAIGAMSLMEAIGEALIVEPWLACVGLGARLVDRAGTRAHHQGILPKVVDGCLQLAFAHLEQEARYTLNGVAAHAAPDGVGHVISGTKRAVANAATSDVLIVSARIDGIRTGFGLFLVDAKAPGVQLLPLRMLDGTRAADVVLDHVRVSGDARLAAGADTLSIVEEAIDFATALVCAEAVGAIRSANAATLEHLKTRRQFGVPIGSFQALQHRAVDLLIEYEQAKSMASLACSAVDREGDATARSRMVSAAKVRIADACRRVSQESVQLHGGMGMSDELKVSHTFRRLTAIAQQFGDADHHLERFAGLSCWREGTQ